MTDLKDRPLTLLVDVDGCLLKHDGDIINQVNQNKVLPGVLEFWKKIDRKGAQIILITGRRESQRKATEKILSELGIFYDKLIMGVTSGKRILINDRKPDSDEDTAIAINLTRNQGLENIDINDL